MSLQNYALPHPTHRLSAAYRHRSPVTDPDYKRLALAIQYRSTPRRSLLLIVADDKLRVHLAALLQANGYEIFAVADADAALALLTIQPIALIIVHSCDTPNAAEIKNYAVVRQYTSKPTLLLPLTVADFNQAELQTEQQQEALQQYLQTIALLWRVFVPA